MFFVRARGRERERERGRAGEGYGVVMWWKEEGFDLRAEERTLNEGL